MEETHHRKRNTSKKLIQVVFRNEGKVLWQAALLALPCGIMGAVLRLVHNHNLMGLSSTLNSWRLSAPAFSAFTALLGFLVIFRTAEGYQRYWNGCQLVQQLNGCFYDAVSSAMAFTKKSKASPQQIAEFKSHVAYYFSLLTALCYADLLATACEEESEQERDIMESFDVLGLQAFTPTHFQALHSAVCRPSLVFHWIQVYLIENIPTGVLDVPGPILGRTFHELAGGLVRYEDSKKLAQYPFPVAYTQTTLWLLVVHWAMTPFCVYSFTKRAFLAFILTWILTFTYWSLFYLSAELENPFGEDDGDIDLPDIHRHLNGRFLTLLQHSSVSISAIGVVGSLESGPLSAVYSHSR